MVRFFWPTLYNFALIVSFMYMVKIMFLSAINEFFNSQVDKMNENA